MLAYHVQGGHQEDAEEFFGFYLDTLEEELLALLASINPSKAGPPTHKVEEREEEPQSGAGWTEVGKRNRMILTRTVCQPFSSLCTELGVVDGRLCVNRPSQWNLLSHVYLAESSVRPCAHRSNVTVSSSKTGDHSNSTFRFVALPYFPFYDLSFILLAQPDSVHTIQDALAHISQPQSVQVGPSGSNEASQQVLIEALPPILVLHLKRFLYDTAARGVVKVGKPVQFGPDLDIPLGAFFFSCFLSRP